MATVLCVVKATITREREAEFNRRYNEERCPQLLQDRGAISARRCRAIMGEDRFQYMAVYGFLNEPALRRLLEPAHLVALKAEYDAHCEGARARERFACMQVWP